MGILEKLRQQQAGVAKRVNADGVAEAADDTELAAPVRREAVQPSGRESSPPAPVAVTSGGGYCRMLPPGVNSFTELGDDWIALNWGATPSPWQRIEGITDHPEFEKNMQAFERNL